MDGLTPMHHAISEGHGEAALVLLRAGADATKRDGDGRLAIDLAPDSKVIIAENRALVLKAPKHSDAPSSFYLRSENTSCKQPSERVSTYPDHPQNLLIILPSFNYWDWGKWEMRSMCIQRKRYHDEGMDGELT
jgi:hypothetical protein